MLRILAENGQASARPELLSRVMADADLAYQNLESVELGVTTVDTYFDTLGGLARIAGRNRNGQGGLPVYIGDTTKRDTRVRRLDEQVALESKTPSPQSQMDRWVAEARLQGCPTDRSSRHQHSRVVSHHWTSPILGLLHATSRRLIILGDTEMREDRGAQPYRIRPNGSAIDRSPPTAILDLTPRHLRLSKKQVGTWKIGSKASK